MPRPDFATPAQPLSPSVNQLAQYLGRSHGYTKRLLARAGVSLSHVRLPYHDERPRHGARHWRRLSRDEVSAVLELRARIARGKRT